MSNDKKTLADAQPGGMVRLGDAPWPEIDAILADAYSAGATGLPFQGIARRHAVRAAVAALSAQPSLGGQDALAEAARRVISDIDSGDYHGEISEATYAALEAALAARLPEGEPVEMPPEFTDTARAAIAWVLWHHQRASSPVGQPLRVALGMGQHDRMTDYQIAEAKRFAAWAGATTEGFHRRDPAQAVDLQQMPHGIRLVEIPRRNGLDPINVFVQDYELGRGRIVVTCYGQAWCGFWGAMGDRTVMQFVAACDADYVAGNMLSGRHEHVKKHERTYVERIATEVIAEFRALIDSQAVGNG